MHKYSDLQMIKDSNFFLSISGEPLKEEDLIVRYIGMAPRREVELFRCVGKSPTAT